MELMYCGICSTILLPELLAQSYTVTLCEYLQKKRDIDFIWNFTLKNCVYILLAVEWLRMGKYSMWWRWVRLFHLCEAPVRQKNVKEKTNINKLSCCLLPSIDYMSLKKNPWMTQVKPLRIIFHQRKQNPTYCGGRMNSVTGSPNELHSSGCWQRRKHHRQRCYSLRLYVGWPWEQNEVFKNFCLLGGLSPHICGEKAGAEIKN